MKNTLLLIAIAIITLSSCESKSSDAAVARIKKEGDSLLLVQQHKRFVEDSLKKEEKRIIGESVKRLKAKTDKFNGYTFYTNPKYKLGYSNEVELYIVKGREYDLRCILQYSGGDWLFVKSVEFMCDGQKRKHYLNNTKRENDGGRVHEYEDLMTDANLRGTIRLIIESKDVTMRYVGSQYVHDRKISQSEKNKMAEVYNALFKPTEITKSSTDLAKKSTSKKVSPQVSDKKDQAPAIEEDERVQPIKIYSTK